MSKNFIGLFDDESGEPEVVITSTEKVTDISDSVPASGLYDDIDDIDDVNTDEKNEDLETKTQKNNEQAEQGEDNKEEESEEVNPWSVIESLIEDKLIDNLPVDIKDPLSAEAVAFQLKEYKKKSIDNYLAEMEKNVPDIFDYYKYIINGGDKTKYFQAIANEEIEDIIYEYQAKDQLKQHYKEKGLTDKHIEKLINLAEEDGSLIEEANNILKSKKEEVKNNRQKLIQEQEQIQKEFENKVNEMSNYVVSKISEGKTRTFIIPETERTDFANYLLPNIQAFKDGSFYLVKQVKQDNLEDILQEAYFTYKKGDLSKIIKQAVNTNKVQELKFNIQNNKQQSKKASNTGGKSPLDSFISTYYK